MIPDLRQALRSIAPLGWLLILLSLLRALFFIANRSAFAAPPLDQGFMIAVQGLRFDAMTLVIANALWILLVLLPFPWRERGWWRIALRTLFITANTAVLFFCCIDLAYYGFNGKRLSRDILGQTGVGLRELPGMALRYWWVTVTFIVALWVVIKASGTRIVSRASWHRAPVFLIIAGLLVLVGRGGWQYQGLSPAHASQHVDPRWAPLVTNSAFTFGYSLAEDPLPQHNWFTGEELDRLMPLRYELRPDSLTTRPNVVLLIVASLAKE